MSRIGVDTGGTFTDFIALDGKRIRTLKLLSTPSNPAEAILRGLEELLDGRECDIRHGSTVATNALLERKGAVAALITTAGFEDVLEIGRQNRPKIYSLFPSRPDPLVPARLRFGAKERVLFDGKVLVPLKSSEVRFLVEKLRRAKVESVAVCLLFSFANPAHEEQIGRALRNLKIPISLSHIILPEFREYERTSTTVVNAYLAPVMGRYLGDLERGLRTRRGRKGVSLRVMQSNGGTVSARSAILQPVRTILSGPAGGVVGAWEVARQSGFPNILSFDMGGTSTDVSLCEGEIRITSESVIANFPIGVPVIDIHTVGAGGGSIARVDQGGALRVGPDSAGADPGPICYGKGERITVTDANLYLGKLDVGYPLGGTLYLDNRRIEPAFRALAREMGAATPAIAAQGVVDVANANMEAALRVISVERGYDPRDFTLVTFGGAGGLHAAQLAASLSVPQVLIPENPGLLSALGVLLSDSVQDFSRTVMLPSEEAGTAAFEERYQELERKGIASMTAEGFALERIRLERWIDMRYRGQSYELSFPYSRSFASQFHRRHEQRYGYADPSRESEVVTIRVRARGMSDKPRMPRSRPGPPDPSRALIKEKQVLFEGRRCRTRIYERALLRAGNRIDGPALIFEYSATTAIPPGHLCIVDSYRNLLLSAER
jgi:N-methylhydantoinase A